MITDAVIATITMMEAILIFVVLFLTRESAESPPGYEKTKKEAAPPPKDDVIIRKIDANGGLSYPASLWPLPPYLTVNREAHPSDPLTQVYNSNYKKDTANIKKKTATKPKDRKKICMNYRMFALTILRCDYPENLPPPLPF